MIVSPNCILSSAKNRIPRFCPKPEGICGMITTSCLRSSARLWEQLREYFEVRFRTEKYGVPYFLAESEAKQSGPRKEAVGARARSGRGFKWKVLRERARRGRNPFKPQTALLHRRPPVGSEWIWRSQTRLRSDFKRTWVRLGERGRRDHPGARRGESLFSLIWPCF